MPPIPEGKKYLSTLRIYVHQQTASIQATYSHALPCLTVLDTGGSIQRSLQRLREAESAPNDRLIIVSPVTLFPAPSRSKHPQLLAILYT